MELSVTFYLLVQKHPKNNKTPNFSMKRGEMIDDQFNTFLVAGNKCSSVVLGHVATEIEFYDPVAA